MVGSSGEAVRVNAVLHIVFECIAIYCHITILDWILVKDISYGNMGYRARNQGGLEGFR